MPEQLIYWVLGLGCVTWTFIEIRNLVRPRIMCRPLEVAAWDKRTGERIDVEWI